MAYLLYLLFTFLTLVTANKDVSPRFKDLSMHGHANSSKRQGLSQATNNGTSIPENMEPMQTAYDGNAALPNTITVDSTNTAPVQATNSNDNENFGAVREGATAMEPEAGIKQVSFRTGNAASKPDSHAHSVQYILSKQRRKPQPLQSSIIHGVFTPLDSSSLPYSPLTYNVDPKNMKCRNGYVEITIRIPCEAVVTNFPTDRQKPSLKLMRIG